MKRPHFTCSEQGLSLLECQGHWCLKAFSRAVRGSYACFLMWDSKMTLSTYACFAPLQIFFSCVLSIYLALRKITKYFLFVVTREKIRSKQVIFPSLLVMGIYCLNYCKSKVASWCGSHFESKDLIFEYRQS